MNRINLLGLIIGVIVLIGGLYFTKVIAIDGNGSWEILLVTLVVSGLFILKSLKGETTKSILFTKVDNYFP